MGVGEAVGTSVAVGLGGSPTPLPTPETPAARLGVTGLEQPTTSEARQSANPGSASASRIRDVPIGLITPFNHVPV
jgi:hypothetical protein